MWSPTHARTNISPISSAGAADGQWELDLRDKTHRKDGLADQYARPSSPVSIANNVNDTESRQTEPNKAVLQHPQPIADSRCP
jgi:hypothetical protein